MRRVCFTHLLSYMTLYTIIIILETLSNYLTLYTYCDIAPALLNWFIGLLVVGEGYTHVVILDNKTVSK